MALEFLKLLSQIPDPRRAQGKKWQLGPVLLATRFEADGLATVLGYGHGDVIRGLDDQWTKGAGPWRTARDGDRLYGRGTADNKGQHTINMAAMRAVLEARGRLGFNAKFMIETGEENGSSGVREVIEARANSTQVEPLSSHPARRLHRLAGRSAWWNHGQVRAGGGRPPDANPLGPLEFSPSPAHRRLPVDPLRAARRRLVSRKIQAAERLYLGGICSSRSWSRFV